MFPRKGVIKSELGQNSLYQIVVQRMTLRRGRPSCGDRLDKRWGHTVGSYIEKEQNGLDMGGNEGEAKMAPHFTHLSGERENQRWETFGAKDGKFSFILCEYNIQYNFS